MGKILFSRISICAGVFLILSKNASAQSWNVTGNNATSTSILGATNSVPLRLFTKNAERLRIDTLGQVGIGTLSPQAILDVNSTTGNQVARFNSTSSKLYIGIYKSNSLKGYVGSYASGVNDMDFGTASGNTTGKTHLTIMSVPKLTIDTAGRVGIGTTTPNNAAILDLTSSNKGLLVPRMTKAQRDAISAPPSGLLIYQLDATPGFYYYNAGWQAMSPAVASANTSLSNLTSPTSIGVNLLPRSTSAYDIGSASLNWRDLYINGTIYSGANKFISGSATSYNNFFGIQAGNSNSGGTYNTGVGYQVLFSNNTGMGNNALGYDALYNNTGGSYNVSVGYETLLNNTAGNYNTAIGHQSLRTNVDGTDNTALGNSALYHNTSGSHNIAIGFQSLDNSSTGSNNVAIGIYSLFDNGSSNYNTAVGDGAGYNQTEDGTFLGANATSNSGLTNVTAIGYGAYATSSNQVVLGNTAVTSIGGQVNWTAFSDGRYKKNIKTDVPGLEFINQLRPVTYNLDMNAIETAKKSGMRTKPDTGSARVQRVVTAEEARSIAEKSKIVYTGFIAQEVEKAAGNLKYDFSGVDAPKSKDGFYGLRYGDFVVPLVKSVQELSKENDSLKSELKDLRTEVEELKQLILQVKGNQPGSGTSIDLSGASLEQNAPNPYSSSTIIRYHVPFSSGVASLVITDAKGTVIRQVNLNNKGDGQVQLNGGSLAAGTYNYSLWIDNKQVDTKRMVIMK